MRTLKVINLVPGMILGQDVLLPKSGATLLAANTILSDEMIRRIEAFQIREVVIKDTVSTEEEEESKLLPILSKQHHQAIAAVEELITGTKDYPLEERVVQGLVSDLLEQLELDSDVLLNLSHLKSYDNYLFSHSVNVSILAILIGEALGYSKEELNLIGTAALLHDLGMMKVPSGIWRKKGMLSLEEMDEIKKHPEYGAKLLVGAGNFPEEVREVVIEHHERVDGSGYPKGLKGKEISFKARIIGITDVYDACISQRPYRNRLTPRQALQIIFLGKEKYDPDILKTFISVMAIYPIGSIVRLNTGEVGKVIRVYRNQPFRPVLRLYFDRAGVLMEHPVRINLADPIYSSLHIKQTLSVEEHRLAQERISRRFEEGIIS